MDERSDHDLLIRLDEKLSEVLRRLDSQDARFVKIESRISLLENLKFWVLGAAAAISLVFSYAKDYFSGR